MDLNLNEGKPQASVWLRHDSLGYLPGQMKPEQPGVNGVQYSPKTGYLYYTNTAKQLFRPATIGIFGFRFLGYTIHMKRTNLVLDTHLLEEATRVFGAKTYSAAVNAALKEVLRVRHIQSLPEFFGSGIW